MGKSWPGYIKTDGEISHINYNKNFKWLKTWIKFNGYKSFKVVISYILIITIIGLFFYKKKSKNLKKVSSKKSKVYNFNFNDWDYSLVFKST